MSQVAFGGGLAFYFRMEGKVLKNSLLLSFIFLFFASLVSADDYLVDYSSNLYSPD